LIIKNFPLKRLPEVFDSALGDPIVKVPAEIGTNFIPMEFVKTSPARTEQSIRNELIKKNDGGEHAWNKVG
jgi:hypothetical protein